MVLLLTLMCTEDGMTEIIETQNIIFSSGRVGIGSKCRSQLIPNRLCVRHYRKSCCDFVYYNVHLTIKRGNIVTNNQVIDYCWYSWKIWKWIILLKYKACWLLFIINLLAVLIMLIVDIHERFKRKWPTFSKTSDERLFMLPWHLIWFLVH